MEIKQWNLSDHPNKHDGAQVSLVATMLQACQNEHNSQGEYGDNKGHPYYGHALAIELSWSLFFV